MARMRTIEQAFAWLREQDPETALTKTALRRMVTTGELPSVRVGQKYLLCLDTLEAHLSGAQEHTAAPVYQNIREVRV